MVVYFWGVFLGCIRINLALEDIWRFVFIIFYTLLGTELPETYRLGSGMP